MIRKILWRLEVTLIAGLMGLGYFQMIQGWFNG